MADQLPLGTGLRPPWQTECSLGSGLCQPCLTTCHASYVGREEKSKKKKYQSRFPAGGKAGTRLGQAGEDACSLGRLG